MTIIDNPDGQTMTEVIARSIMLHPTLFADACAHVAGIHRGFVQVTHDRVASRIASDMAAKLTGFARALRDGTATVPDVFGLQVMTFSIASRLQCLPVTRWSD
jgi:hypothetical protein